MALYDLTPLGMAVRSQGPGLSIDLALQGEARACELCASRLSVIAAVRVATLSQEQRPAGNRW